jgi:hypothetical protein
MHIKTLIRQTDGDSRSHCGFAHTAFAHQHNQAVVPRRYRSTRTDNGLYSLACSVGFVQEAMLSQRVR